MARRTIRYFHDHGHPWPLWESGTEKYTMEPQDYGLSPDTMRLLERAQSLWLAYADAVLAGAPSSKVGPWRQASDAALRALRREVGDAIDVVDERFR